MMWRAADLGGHQVQHKGSISAGSRRQDSKHCDVCHQSGHKLLAFTPEQVALIGMTAYLSYVLGDVLGLSGILALFVCAVTISHYALHNIRCACA